MRGLDEPSISEQLQMPALTPHPHRGVELLLVHCAAVSNERPSAYARLEQALGGELAQMLVCALVGAILAVVLTVVIYSRLRVCLDSYNRGTSEYNDCIQNHL